MPIIILESVNYVSEHVSTICPVYTMGDRGTAIYPLMLSSLVHKSFIQDDRGSDRYQMHELLRQYGAEKLAQDPVREAKVRDQHSRYFCRWLQEHGARLQSDKQKAALDEIEAEIDNVRTACNWAASQGRIERVNDALDALVRFYDWRRSYQAGEIVLGSLAERLTAAWDPSSPMTDIAHQTIARVLMWQCKFHGMLGNEERREQLALESLAHLDSPSLAGHDTRLERAHLLVQLAYAQYWEDLETAKESFARSHDLSLELGDRRGLADALVGLGRVARNLHAYDEAEGAFSQSLALRQAAGDRIGSAEALTLLSNIALAQAQFVKAERLVRQSLAITRDAPALSAWGLALICSGRFVEAQKPLAESLALCTDLGMRVASFWAVLNQSHIQLHLGDHQLAGVHAGEALSLARQLNLDRQTGIALAQLGAVALAEGEFALAYDRCEESLAIGPGPYGLLSPRVSLGLAAHGLGHRDEAGGHFQAELKWAVRHRGFFTLVYALSGIALLLADRGQAERAVEVYALAARIPLVANSRWFEEIAGHAVAAVAARLSPKVTQAARARGQAADLWQAAAECLEMLAA